MSSAFSPELPAGFTAMTVVLSAERSADSGCAIPAVSAGGGGLGRAGATSIGGKVSVEGVSEIAGATALGSSLACVELAAFVGGWTRASCGTGADIAAAGGAWGAA